MRKLSWLLILGGLLLGAGSYWRYFVIYQDHSQGITGILFGLSGIALGWIYDSITNLRSDLDFVKRQADSIGAEVFGETKEARKELGLGVQE